MFDGDIDTSQEHGRFSTSREVAIGSIVQHIIEHDITQVLTEEVFTRTSLLSHLTEAAPRIVYSQNFFQDSLTALEKQRLTSALLSGMAFACWTHDAENNSMVRSNIVESLEYSSSCMLQARHLAVDARDLYAQYESAMEHVDAVDALEACIDQERELVEYCSRIADPYSEEMSRAFKSGYGFLRQAALSPYGIMSERNSFNLDILGVTAQSAEIYRQYANEDLVFEGASYQTQLRRSQRAVERLEKDIFIRSFFQKGQHLTVAEGIYKTMSAPGAPYSSRYHAVRPGARHSISGEFDHFVADASLTEGALEAIKQHAHVDAVDVGNFNAQDFAGLYVVLKSPVAHFASPEYAQDPASEFPIAQQVTIPLDIPGQQIIYRK